MSKLVHVQQIKLLEKRKTTIESHSFYSECAQNSFEK